MEKRPHQVQDTKYQRFVMYHSGNVFPYQDLVGILDLKSFECTKDPHGINQTTFTTRIQRRVSQVERILCEYNKNYPSKAIRLEGMDGGPPIVTFDIHTNPKDHHVIKAIDRAREKKGTGIDVFYKIWNLDIQGQTDDDMTLSRNGQDTKYRRFVMYHSGNVFPYKDLVDTLDLKSFEFTKDPHGINQTTFTTRIQRRVSQVERILCEYNKNYPSKAIRLEGMDGGPPIVTFDIHTNPKDHHVIKAIDRAREKKGKGIDVFYKIWNLDIQGQTDDDMILSRNSHDLSKNPLPVEIQANKVHPLLVEQLFYPELLAQIEEWDIIEKRLKESHGEDDICQTCPGTVYFASTPTLPGVLKIGGTKHDGATRVRQLYTAGVPEKYTCLFEFKCSDWRLYEGVVHEVKKVNRLYSRKEFFIMTPEEARKLVDQVNEITPRSRTEEMVWRAAMDKVSIRLERSRAKSRLNRTSQCSDNIVSVVSGQQQILAIQSLLDIADTYASDSEVLVQHEPPVVLNQSFVDSRSPLTSLTFDMLFIVCAHMDTSRQLEMLCCTNKMFYSYLRSNDGVKNWKTFLNHNPTMELNDILYLSSFNTFVFHLKHRKLTAVEGNAKLKGVSPAIPFSDVAFRRYFDHILCYRFHKAASKSDDKHRLYLGLLNGPIYPEAVVLVFRERLLEQIEFLCKDLGRSIPYKKTEVAALLPPIEGDPFELEEMKAWNFLSGHSHNSEEMRRLKDKYPTVPDKIYWQYLVFLHRCNFNGVLRESTNTILKMLQGPMYTEAAFIAMEKPLLERFFSLFSELKKKDPIIYLSYGHDWHLMADQMERVRDSSHIKLGDDGRSNEYFAYVKSNQSENFDSESE